MCSVGHQSLFPVKLQFLIFRLAEELEQTGARLNKILVSVVYIPVYTLLTGNAPRQNKRKQKK